MAIYFIGTIPRNKFKQSLFVYTLLSPFVLSHAYATYLRKVVYQEHELKLEELYGDDCKIYSEFFLEQSY